jgi:hypothetical protein
MNFDTTDYSTDDLGQVDVNCYTSNSYAPRSKTASSYSPSFYAVVKRHFTAMMNSWML